MVRAMIMLTKVIPVIANPKPQISAKAIWRVKNRRYSRLYMNDKSMQQGIR